MSLFCPNHSQVKADQANQYTPPDIQESHQVIAPFH